MVFLKDRKLQHFIFPLEKPKYCIFNLKSKYLFRLNSALHRNEGVE